MNKIATDRDTRSETELVERAKKGDMQAFQSLIAPCHSRLIRMLIRVTRDIDDARDALQEAMLKAFTRIGQFRGDSAFFPWMRSIALNQALLSLRARRTRCNVFLPLLEGENGECMVDPAEPGPGPEHWQNAKECGTVLSRIVSELSPRYREVFEMRCVHELSTGETSKRLGIPAPMVKSRLHRARTTIRARFSAITTRRPTARARSTMPNNKMAAQVPEV